jgi:glutaredoxin
MWPMEGGTRAQCAEHGLATGPGGRCVLCRRAEGTRNSRLYERLAFGALGVLALGVAGAVLERRMRPSPVVAPVVEVAPDDAPETPRPEAHAAPRPTSASPLPAPVRPRASVPAAAVSAQVDDAAARRAEDRERRQEIEAAMRHVSIRMYTTRWCPRCTEAKVWLAANRYAFTELDVESSDSNRREQRALNPNGTVPTIDVEGDVLVGFGAASLEGAIRRAAERRVQRY